MTHRQIMEALTGLLAAFFTAIISSTIVANALPTIMSELKGSQTDFAWVITAALLANAATTPIWGKLADLFNKKFLVQLSIVIFVAGSVMAGLSETIPLLLTARVIQGIAMGGLTALAMAIIGSIIPPRDRGKYSGYMGAVMAVGTAGGPLLGGFIVDSPLGWRWTFFVCVPLAVVALILLQITLKLPHVRRPAKIDWLGSILLDLRRQPAADLGLLRRQPGLLRLVVLADGRDGRRRHRAPGPAGARRIPRGPAHHPARRSSRSAPPPSRSSPRWPSASACSAPPPSSASTSRWHAAPAPPKPGLLTLPMIAGNLIGSVALRPADQPHRKVEALPRRRVPSC